MSKLEIHDASKEERGYIGRQLDAYNNSQVPFTQQPPDIPIQKCIKENGEVVAGILADIYCWNILHIGILWVKEEYRGKGYGSALIKHAEDIAIKNGCKLAHLDTFDFQARGLYEKLGYTVFGVLEDCPEGHCRYYMSKKLQPPCGAHPRPHANGLSVSVSKPDAIKDNLRNYYNQEADLRDSYGKVEWKTEERKAFLDLTKAENKQTFLELGAGTGDDSRFFMENGLTVTAVDLSPAMVQKCREKSIDAHELDYYNVADLGKKFQCIWAMNSLLHVPKADLPRVLKAIDSVLEEGGLFFMGVYGGEDNEHEYIKSDVSEHPRFFSSYSKEALQDVLAQQFEIISFRQYDVHRGRSFEFQSILMRKRG